ncbi:MAG: DMT family transporter [Bacteroidota bacterium]|nr:DMT family transporter [Bacteroidota bacterium]
MKREKIINWIIFIVLSVIWGSSFILMKESSKELNGWQIGSIRIFSAGVIFLPFALFHIRDIPRGKIPIVILSGFLGNFFPAFLFAIAIERKIESSLAGILNSLTPLLVIVIAILFFKAKIESKKIVGVLIGLAGLLIFNFSAGGMTLSNFGFILLILLATIFYSLNVNIITYYLKGVDPIKIATVSLAILCFLAAIIMWQQHVFSIAKYDQGARISIVYAGLLGIVGSAFATALFYILIKRAGGLFASLVTYAFL